MQNSKGAEWYPFLSGGATGRGALGVGGPSGVSTPKSKRAIQKERKKKPPVYGVKEILIKPDIS
jgi:hypothetical protein